MSASLHTRTTGRSLLFTLGAGTALATGIVMCPYAAQAADYVSQASGTMLHTTLLTTSLVDSIASLGGAQAQNSDGTTDVTSDAPLDVSLLDGAVGVPIASGIDLLGSQSIIHLGAVGQYAEADADGSSKAFSGTASKASSLIGVGAVTPGAGDADAGANAATLDLGAASDPVALDAAIGVIAAGAKETAGGSQSGDYTLSDVDLTVGGSVLGGVLGTINPLLNTLIGAVNTAIGGGGDLDPITNPLASGKVTVSLEDLLAVAGVSSVNDLTAGTDLTQYIPAAVAAKVTSLVTAITAAVNADLTALGHQGLLGATLATALNLAVGTPLATISGLLGNLTTTLVTPLGGALSDLVSLKVGKQSTDGGVFTETALTVGVVNGGDVTSIALANAAVGPNAGELAVPIIHPEALGLLSIGGIVAIGIGFAVFGGKKRRAAIAARNAR